MEQRQTLANVTGARYRKAGKTAFITGAAHGQGRATALLLAREGADILGFDVAKTIEYPAYTFGAGRGRAG